MADVLRAHPSYPAVPSDELIRRRRSALGPLRLMYPERAPLHFVEASDVWMRDVSGRRYLDAYNNVPVVGHGHPRVADAVARQMARLNTNTRYLHEAVVVAAEELLARFPSGFDRVFFVNSGSEANDLAWRLACFATGRGGALVTDSSYFGITVGARALSPRLWGPGEEHAHVGLVRSPDDERALGRADDPSRWQRLLGEAEARAGALEAAGFGVAATIIDSLYTSDGILEPPAAYVDGLAGLVRAHGGLVIADEIQGGFARTGSGFWSFSRLGLSPDIVTLGKPMGNGFPVGAVVTRSDLFDPFVAARPLFSTFGGNPVAAAAVLAVLGVIEDEGLQANAEATGRYLRERLGCLAGSESLVADVRGAGLMIGVELARGETPREPASEAARKVRDDLVERGVLIGTTGRNSNVLKVRPPLTFSREHADLLMEALTASLEEIALASS